MKKRKLITFYNITKPNWHMKCKRTYIQALKMGWRHILKGHAIAFSIKSGNISVRIEFIDCIINKTTGILIFDGYADYHHTGADLSVILSNTPISIDLGNDNIMNSKIWKIENS